MAQNESDDERLLAIIEPAPDATLPPGYKWGRPMDMCIGPPVAEFKTVQRGNKVVKVMTPESRKADAAYRTMKWEALDRNSDLAAAIWEAKSIALHEEMERERKSRERDANTAKPVEFKGLKPLRIIRV